MNTKFLNHGQGILTIQEHDEMVKIGAMRCHQGKKIDGIIYDYPKLMIHKKDDEISIDTDGDLQQLRFEKDAQERKGVKCHIEYFPRAYTDFMAKKDARRKAWEMETEANKQLS